MKKQYTLEELVKLRDYYQKPLDDTLDDYHGSDKSNFNYETDKFFVWLGKMEQNNRIEYLLTLNN